MMGTHHPQLLYLQAVLSTVYKAILSSLQTDNIKDTNTSIMRIINNSTNISSHCNKTTMHLHLMEITRIIPIISKDMALLNQSFPNNLYNIHNHHSKITNEDVCE